MEEAQKQAEVQELATGGRDKGEAPAECKQEEGVSDKRGQVVKSAGGNDGAEQSRGRRLPCHQCHSTPPKPRLICRDIAQLLVLQLVLMTLILGRIGFLSLWMLYV